jgi:hypothetical protein
MSVTLIAIKDPKEFLQYLNAILKIVPSCKFIIDSQKCTVRAITESSTVKAFFDISSVRSKDEIEFCLQDVQKLAKAISLIVEYNPDADKGIIINHSEGKIYYKQGGLSFKFTTVRHDTIERWITNPLKRELTPSFGMVIDNKIISKVNSLAGISSSEKPKLYLYNENGVISAEVDDKTNKITDSAGIPIAKDEKIQGTWTQSVCLNLDTFRMYGAIESDAIKVSMTERGVMLVHSENGKMKMELVSTVLKG